MSVLSAKDIEYKEDQLAKLIFRLSLQAINWRMSKVNTFSPTVNWLTKVNYNQCLEH